MSNLIFYARAIDLRNRYFDNAEFEKFEILAQIVNLAFREREYENLPKKFHFPLVDCYYSETLLSKIGDVLTDIGYSSMAITKEESSNKVISICIEIFS